MGAGAPMTCAGQTINSIGAVIDSAGNWCAFDLNRINNMGGFRFGWFGAVGGGADDTAALQATFDAAFNSGLNTVYCTPAYAGSGGYSFSLPLFFDPPGGLRGLGLFSFQGEQGFFQPGFAVTLGSSPATTAASGTGTTATLTFSAQPNAFPVGSTIQVNGVTPLGYNGNFIVTASSTTSVSYANITTGAQTVAGTVTGRVPYANNTTQNAHGQPPTSPDYSGVGMDLGYRIINSTAAIAYNPTYTVATPANAVAAASFKGSGTIGTPVVISKNTGIGTSAVPIATSSPAGALLVVAVTDWTGNPVTGVTDSKSNTYAIASSVDNPTLGGTYIFYAANAAALTAGTDTITISGAGDIHYIATYTTGIATTTPLDKTNFTDNTSVTTNSPSVTLPATGVFSQANEIVFGTFVNATYVTGTNAVGNGFTESAGFTTTTPALWSLAVWNSGTTYQAGNVVVINGVSFQSLQQNNINNFPLADLGPDGALIFWQPISQFSSTGRAALLYGPPQITPGSFNQGCNLRAGFNNSVALSLMPGNGVTVDSVFLSAPGGSVHCTQPGTGAGIAIYGGSAGANRTRIRNSGVNNFYHLYVAGISTMQQLSGGSLAAENKWDNDYAQNGCIAFSILNTQGFINSIVESTVESNTMLLNTSSVGTMVLGGNWSNENQSYPSRTFPVSITSAVVDAGGIVFSGSTTEGASFTGSISGTVLTASAVTGTINVGDALTGGPGAIGNVINGNQIVSQISGPAGGAGTYNIAFNAGTVASEPMFTGDNLLNGADMMVCGPDAGLPVHFWTGPGSNAVGGANFIGSISGTTLTVTSVSSGAIAIGQQFSSSNVAAYTTITAGGGSSWTINNSQTVPAGSSMATSNYYNTGQNCNQAGYNAWMINPVDGSGNTRFGVIPAVLVSYNKNTHQAKWRVIDEWFQGWGRLCCANLLAAIQAQTFINAAEKARVFVGSGITADRMHMETVMPWQLVDNTFWFGTPLPTTVKNVFIDADPACGSCTRQQFLASTVFPFINVNGNGGNIYLENLGVTTLSGGSSAAGDNLLIDFGSPQSPDLGRLSVKGSSLGRFNFRYPANGSGLFNMTGNYGSAGSPIFAAGAYDTTPWTSYANNSSNPSGFSIGNGDFWSRTQGLNSGPYNGVRPAPWSTPCLSPSQLSAINPGPPPAIVHTGTGFSSGWSVPYTLLWSGQQYKVCDWSGAIPTHWGFVSNHVTGFSYGQAIGTTLMGAGFTWQNYSNSPAITVPVNGTTNNLGLFFPGLVINLAGTQTGCTGAENFMVREVHLNDQYLMVFRVDNDSSGSLLPAWTAATPFLCSNTSIGQAAYSFTNLN
jgi:hypothetical protein